MRHIYVDGYFTPKNCKFGRRPRQGLLLTGDEWWRINNHLYWYQDEKAEQEVMLLDKEKKKKKSQEITADWENTLARLKELSDQMRLERIEKDKQAKIDEYNAIIEKQKLEKEAIINNAKKLLFEDKDTTKQLVASLAHSAIIHERNKQKQFNQMLRMKDKERKAKFAEKILKDAENYEADKEREKLEDIEKKKRFRQFLDDQMLYVKFKEEERLREIEREKQDNINICLELEETYAREKETRKKSQEHLQNVIDTFMESEDRIRKRRQLEEKQDDILNQIFLDTAAKIETARRIKEEKMIREKWIARWKFAEKAAELYVPDEGKTDEQVEAEKMKIEEEEQKRKDERKAKKEKLVKELLKAEEDAKREYERRGMMEREERKWETVQKYKRQELNEIWEKEERARIQGIKDRLKAAYMAQWKETEEKKLMEKDDNRVLLEELRREKEELNKYCDEVLDYTNERGRPVFPVLTAVRQVKKQCGIIKPKKPLYYLKSNVPIESIAIYAKKRQQ